MAFMSWIVSRFNDVGAWFYGLYLDAWNAIYIPAIVADWFYDLAVGFYGLAGNFSEFGSWVNVTVGRLTEILTWSTIWSWITASVPNLTSINTWYSNWTTNVVGAMGATISAVQTTIGGWISTAAAFLQDQVNAIAPLIDGLRADWTNFWTVTWPGIPDWIGIGDLINTRTAELAPFWAGWADWRDQVAEFMTSPLDWIVSRFESWFWD